MIPSAQRAIVEGSEYFWDADGFSTNVSLLWRTNYDGDRAGGYSGSVLCYGKTTDKTALAVLFQNYESPLKLAVVERDRRPTVSMGAQYNPTFKGGFLLPEEIRQATINMCSSHTTTEYRTLQYSRARASTDTGRRSVTGPPLGL